MANAVTMAKPSANFISRVSHMSFLLVVSWVMHPCVMHSGWVQASWIGFDQPIPIVGSMNSAGQPKIRLTALPAWSSGGRQDRAYGPPSARFKSPRLQDLSRRRGGEKLDQRSGGG